MKTNSLLAGLFMVIATICVGVFLFAPAVTPDSNPDALSGENTTASSDVKYLPVTFGMSTLVGFDTSGPPPWKNGNCFSLAGNQNVVGPRVINMNSETFGRAVKDFHLDNVKIKMLGDRHCMVIDPRIPKSWLLAEPCPHCTSPEIANLMLHEYTEQAKNP